MNGAIIWGIYRKLRPERQDIEKGIVIRFRCGIPDEYGIRGSIVASGLAVARIRVTKKISARCQHVWSRMCEAQHSRSKINVNSCAFRLNTGIVRNVPVEDHRPFFQIR